MAFLGSLVNAGTQQAPFLMGIIVSVLMGMILTLPISSAALGIILDLSGIAAGAATVGCCANMVGFAVASYKDNKVNGLLAQGLGTSMIQIGNIVKKPIIWLPAIVASAILGVLFPRSYLRWRTMLPVPEWERSGLVGQITTFQTMAANEGAVVVIIKIIVLHFILPAIIAGGTAMAMRKMNLIKDGDMKLEV